MPSLLPRPLNAAVRAIQPADLSALEGLPGVEYEDGKVSFVEPDFQKTYEGWFSLIRMAQAGYMGTLYNTLKEHPEGEEIREGT